jgi:hypothetical protein
VFVIFLLCSSLVSDFSERLLLFCCPLLGAHLSSSPVCFAICVLRFDCVCALVVFCSCSPLVFSVHSLVSGVLRLCFVCDLCFVRACKTKLICGPE